MHTRRNFPTWHNLFHRLHKTFAYVGLRFLKLMDPATNDHRLVRPLTSFLGTNARSSVLRLTLFTILAFVLFQLVSVSHFGRCVMDGCRITVVQFSSSFSSSTSDGLQSLLRHASRTPPNFTHKITSGRVLVTGGGGNIGTSYSLPKVDRP